MSGYPAHLYSAVPWRSVGPAHISEEVKTWYRNNLIEHRFYGLLIETDGFKTHEPVQPPLGNAEFLRLKKITSFMSGCCGEDISLFYKPVGTLPHGVNGRGGGAKPFQPVFSNWGYSSPKTLITGRRFETKPAPGARRSVISTISLILMSVSGLKNLNFYKDKANGGCPMKDSA
jgi:hypothetical protein